MNQNEQIIKKEDKLTYWKGIFNGKRGSLVLSTMELYFIYFGKRVFTVPLTNIISVNCQKGIGTSNENMFILYKNGGKEQKIKIQHSSLMSLATVGNLSRVGSLYFSSWEQAINEARRDHKDISGNNLDDIKKLADLRNQGVITDEEFLAKKKQLLGI